MMVIDLNNFDYLKESRKYINKYLKHIHINLILKSLW